MRKVSIISCLIYCFTVTFNTTQAQVTIGAGTAPDEDAVLELVSNTDKGLLLPRLELQSTSVPSPLTRHVAGMVVYNTGTTIAPGYYFNDGTRWIPVADGNSVSWNDVSTQQGATSNTQDIYQMGAVAVGALNISPNTQFEVNSNSRGMLMPRLSTAERNAITGQIPNGLLIFNTTTNCFNYYNGSASIFSDGGITQWISLCGTYDPSSFDLLSCDPPTGPSGDLLQGTSLTESNTYTIVINVSVPGTYEITATAGNGYSYSDSGIFHESGTYTITLVGQGTPRTAGTNNMTIRFNGTLINPSCTLPPVVVNPAGTIVVVDCTPTINGDYLRNTSVNALNFVSIPVTSVPSSGVSVVTTDIVNGIYFSSGSVAFDGSTTSLQLFAQGTPLNVGTYTYTFIPPGGITPCFFDITVGTTVGTFANPARNCLAILNEDPSKPNGEYWVQSAAGSGSAVKTFCDMANGGYTLIWSYSERTSYVTYAPAGIQNTNTQLTANLPYNVVDTELGTINYYNYRLSRATMQNVINSSLGIGEYKVRIAYNPTDMDDAWGNANYLIALPKDKTYDYVNSGNASWVYPGTSIPFQGQIFGLPVNGNVNPATYNGVAVPGYSMAPYYGGTTYGAHWDTGGRVPSTNITTNFPTFEGTIISRTFNPNSFNNLFGFFGELDGNHLWGKCVNSAETPVAGNDYDFTIPTCYGNVGLNSGYNHLVPHSFNGGEGRVLQWFVK